MSCAKDKGFKVSEVSEGFKVRAFAYRQPDEAVRKASSSGGAFTALAAKVIGNGGEVYGAAWSETLDVEHRRATTIEQLQALRGSKYVHSRLGQTFAEVLATLNEGRQVMFVGTPCQTKALRLFLDKSGSGLADSSNLLLVDFICHGVASPIVWHHYLKWQEGKLSRKYKQEVRITSVSMRDKRNGWKDYQVTLGYEGTKAAAGSSAATIKGEISEHASDNPFTRAHGSNLILSSACYKCQAKGGTSGSDITLADFWGIDRLLPEMNDDRGTSLVLVNTKRGEEAFAKAMSDADASNLKEIATADALANNRSWSTPSAPHPKQAKFMATYAKASNFRLHVLKFAPYTIRGFLRYLRRQF